MPILNDQKCPHETNLTQINKAIFGNGNKGLVRDVTEINLEIVGFKDDIKKLATSYSALVKSEIKKDAMEKARLELDDRKLEERKKRTVIIQRLGTIFGIIFGAGTLLYIVLDHIGNH